MGPWDAQKKRGQTRAEKSYKHHLDAYDGTASIINIYSQISHQICNSGDNQRYDTREVLGSVCQSVLVLWEWWMPLGKLFGEDNMRERSRRSMMPCWEHGEHGESGISAAEDRQTVSICSGPPGSEHSRTEKFLDQLSRNWETPGYCTRGGFLLPRHLLGKKCS